MAAAPFCGSQAVRVACAAEFYLKYSAPLPPVTTSVPHFIGEEAEG